MQALQAARPDQYGEFSGMFKYDPITGALNPNLVSNMPVYGGNTASNMPVYSGNDDDGPSMRDIMAERRLESQRRSANLGPRDSSPRPVLRGQSTGSSGGLLSGIRSARDEVRNTVLDALGVI